MAARITSAHGFTEAAAPFRDRARSLAGVTAVSPGEISKVAPSGNRHVKMTDEKGCILLTIRGYGNLQQVRVYGREERMQEIKLDLARFVRNLGYTLKFGHK